MAPAYRLVVALSIILLLGGAAGVVIHHPAAGDRAAPAAPAVGKAAPGGVATTTVTPSAPASTPPASAVASVPGPGTGTLEAGLITPTDMGGYYRVVPSAGSTLLSSAPCLAVLGPASGQSGRALTALLGPDQHSVPAVVEEVSSYPGATAGTRYRADVSTLRSCRYPTFDFGGTEVTARLAPSAIPSVGDADQAWAGSFSTGGAAFTIQLGLVLDADEVLALLWIDSVPGSDPVMGGFTSTLSLAIGKLA